MRIKKTSTHGLTVILDAYNVIHKVPALEKMLDVNLEASRNALINYCRRFRELKGNIARMILVFDGARRRGSLWKNVMTYEEGCEIIFSDTDQSADDKIIELLEKLDRPEASLVVSSDNYVANNARAHQVRVLSVQEFNAVVKNAAPAAVHHKEIDLHEAQRITEEYRNYLGIK